MTESGQGNARGKGLAPLRVGVLGPVRVWRGEQALAQGPSRQQAVLAILAIRANQVVSRDDLIDGLWGQDPPASAEGGVYTYVGGLRRAMEPARSRRERGRVLVSAGAGYMLRIDPGHLDSGAFEEHLRQARRVRANDRAAEALASLDAGLGLWRGTPFAGAVP